MSMLKLVARDIKEKGLMVFLKRFYRLKTIRVGQKIGEDRFGNQYFESPTDNYVWGKQRWVEYKHEVEATSVPADWHSWLHHVTDRPPGVQPILQPEPPTLIYDHPPTNATGTNRAFYPTGHFLNPVPRPYHLKSIITYYGDHKLDNTEKKAALAKRPIDATWTKDF